MEQTRLQDQEIEINLHDYIDIVHRRRWLIATFAIVVFSVVTVATFLQTPIYRATTTMLIDEESPDVLAAKDGLTLGSPGYVSYREYYQTQLEIIRSRSIAKDVFAALGLASSEEYADLKDPIKAFLMKLKVEPSRNTRLVYIHFEDSDEEIATRVVNMIANIYAARNLISISKNENVNLIKNEYLKLQAKYSEYSKIYKSKHPKMVRLKEEIAQLEERMKKEEADPFKATGLKANNVRVIDEAEIPKSPVRPKKLQNILLALIVGLAGGVGLAFMIEYLDNTLKSPEDIERHAQLPLLGYVPAIDKSYADMQKDRIVNVAPTLPISESYRSVRTAILFSNTEERTLKDLLVTSAGPQDGKSITACNLAITMAQSGNSVLLVDADMRKPRIHQVFGMDSDVGLSNYLAEQEGLEKIIRRTDIENLSIVTCGHIPPNPSELLGSKRMTEFLDAVKRRFQTIILDSPPIAVVTDAVILSSIMDGTVLVVNSRKTTRQAVHRAKQLLAGARANLLGVVLNNLLVERKSSYYYAHYYYSDSAKKSKQKSKK